jgi:hypothetical protein
MRIEMFCFWWIYRENPQDKNTQFIYSNRDVYIAIRLCSSLLQSAIAI